MSTLIKVSFRTTSGEETTGSAQYDADSGLVILPDRLVSRIDLARSTGDRYAITAYEGGYQYPLVHAESASYRLEKHRKAKSGLRQSMWKAISEPTKAQREQYGRYHHSLSAASVVGMVGYIGSSPGWSTSHVLNVLGLFAAAVVLFLIGAVLCKGDES